MTRCEDAFPSVCSRLQSPQMWSRCEWCLPAASVAKTRSLYFELSVKSPPSSLIHSLLPIVQSKHLEVTPLWVISNTCEFVIFGAENHGIVVFLAQNSQCATLLKYVSFYFNINQWKEEDNRIKEMMAIFLVLLN